MRYQSFLTLFCALFFNSFYAQEANISQGKWDTIVDYANARVTLAYIDDLYKTDKPDEEEKVYFTDTLKPELKKSSFKSPISYDSLSVLMAPHFERTFENLSSEIEDAKNKSKVFDSLFNTVKAALRGVKKEEIYVSGSIEALKAEIKEFIETKPKEVQDPRSSSAEEAKEQPPNLLHFSVSNIAIGILVLLLILVLWQFVTTKAKLRKLEEKAARYREERDFEKGKNYKNQSIISKLTKGNEKLEKEKIQAQENVKDLKDKSQNVVEPELESPIEYHFEKPTPLPPPSPKIFYGGKPTTNRSFSEVTDKIKEQETIFKFTFVDDVRTKANFQVILVSDFMKKQITNSPDDFLYRVCNNKNSNQDFRREIITEREGVAHLRDGIWDVDENDKALIKFQ